MRIYLAGPDVFRPDVQEWAAWARDVCNRNGFEALLPIDHEETEPQRIYRANLELIRKSQIVAANLNPFRGIEPDSGTAFELGYAHALSKRLIGYLDTTEPLAARVLSQEGKSLEIAGSGSELRDRDGMTIENFGLACNLMLAVPVRIVEGDLESCLVALRANRAA